MSKLSLGVLRCSNVLILRRIPGSSSNPPSTNEPQDLWLGRFEIREATSQTLLATAERRLQTAAPSAFSLTESDAQTEPRPAAAAQSQTLASAFGLPTQPSSLLWLGLLVHS